MYLCGVMQKSYKAMSFFKRQLLILFMLLMAVHAGAQKMAVKDFRLLETDLTANTHGTSRLDQNGETAALIKIVTTEKGFTFEGGSLGIVGSEQKTGEIWLYVPRYAQKLTIKHPLLGVLRDYAYPQTIQGGRTYAMELVTGIVETTVRQARTTGYILFKLTPANAVVELDGEMLQTTDGTATIMKRFGTYSYSVKAPMYQPSSGRVELKGAKQEVAVQLKPNFTSVTLNAGDGVEIWVNGERKGTGSWTGNLGAGEYLFETKRASHRDAQMSRVISLEDGPQTIKLPAPTPIVGDADINSAPALADVYIDGTKVGQTPFVATDILVGSHTVKITRSGYEDYTATLTVREGETASLSATLKKGETQVATPQGGTALTGTLVPITVNGVTFNMIKVEGGTFTMGATSEQRSDAYSDEKPVHQVTLSSYYIGETEVTQALWQAVMGNNPSSFKGENRPVEEVSWDDCKTFISKLNSLTGKHFRLPSEAEWEYAARGGNKSQGYKYSGSNTLGNVAWYTDNSGNETHPVNTKSPNELGIYDMSGNVWEWCQDWEGAYSSSSQTNPTGASSGSHRVLRGGGWGSSARYCRVSNRVSYAPDDRDYGLGLRLVL